MGSKRGQGAVETFQSIDRQLVVHPPPALARAHESCLSQDSEVVAEQVRRNWFCRLEVAHAGTVLGEASEDAESNWIGDHREQLARLGDRWFKHH
jgi:hypothetical protein